MSSENVTWGTLRILSELLLLGYDVADSTIAKYMVQKQGAISCGRDGLTVKPGDTDGVMKIYLKKNKPIMMQAYELPKPLSPKRARKYLPNLSDLSSVFGETDMSFNMHPAHNKSLATRY